MIIGVVGKANVGKSTFFKSVTLADILIANYPFATIDPNKGVGFVRVQCVDRELGVQCNPRVGACHDGTRFVPVDIIDVAGLVPGAHEGKGMGNKFLDDLRPADVLIHVVDMAGSTNEKGEPVDPGAYDPAFDIKFLEFEIDMWYLGIIRKGWDKFAKVLQMEKKPVAPALAEQLSGLGVKESMVEAVFKQLSIDPANPVKWTEEDLHRMAVEFRKRTKPMIIAANKMDLPSAKANLERIRKEFPHLTIMPCSAESELSLRQAAKAGLIKYVPGNKTFEKLKALSPAQEKALDFIQKNMLDVYGSSGVQSILDVAIFDLLKYIAIFPGGIGKLGDSQGRILPDCFLLPEGSTALDFAFRIHTDLGKKFIRAIDVRSRMTRGKEWMLKSRDVVEIVSGK